MKKKMLSKLLPGILASIMLSGCGNAVVDERNVTGQESGEKIEASAEEAEAFGSKESAGRGEEPVNEESVKKSNRQEEMVEESEETEEEAKPEMITVYLPVKEIFYEEIETPDGYIHNEYHNYEYEYDGYGNRTKQIVHENKYTAEKVAEERAYEYDNAGRILKRIIYITDESGEKNMLEEGEYEYSNQGNLLKSTVVSYEQYKSRAEAFGPQTVYESDYDDRGNVIKTVGTRYMKDGSKGEVDTFEYEYDAEGRTVKWVQILSNGLTGITRTEYDERGSVVLYRGIDECEDGTEKTTFATKYQYQYTVDDAGNVVKKAYYIEGNEDKKFLEEYDANGNIIRHATIWSDPYTTEATEYEYIEMQVPDVPKVD